MKDVYHRTTNKCPKLKTQWSALCWGSRTVSSILPYRSFNANNHERFGQQIPANREFLWLETFCAVVDVAGNCGDHTTGDRAESKSANTSSQSGNWHPKVHCVTNLALHTEEKGLSHPGAGPHPTAHYGFFFFAEKTITSTSYLDMLEQFLQPQLFADNILDLVVFQQDCAPPHFVYFVITSARRSQDDGLDEAHHGCGQHARVIKSLGLLCMESHQDSGEQGGD